MDRPTEAWRKGRPRCRAGNLLFPALPVDYNPRNTGSAVQGRLAFRRGQNKKDDP